MNSRQHCKQEQYTARRAYRGQQFIVGTCYHKPPNVTRRSSGHTTKPSGDAVLPQAATNQYGSEGDPPRGHDNLPCPASPSTPPPSALRHWALAQHTQQGGYAALRRAPGCALGNGNPKQCGLPANIKVRTVCVSAWKVKQNASNSMIAEPALGAPQGCFHGRSKRSVRDTTHGFERSATGISHPIFIVCPSQTWWCREQRQVTLCICICCR